jgi:SulP family sulfate permease
MAISKWREFLPESYRLLREGYSFSSFRKDFLAGITVGILAIPIALAFAISSGASPEQGLYTAIIGGFLVSLFSGSRVQIGGPGAVLVLISFQILQKSGYQELCLSMLAASIFLIIFGVCKLGSWIKYVPTSVIIGCTSGIALSIFSLQIPDFLGLQIKTEAHTFINHWISYYEALSTMNVYSTFLGIGSIALIVLLQRKAPKIPWGLTVIMFGIAVCFCFNLPIETIGSHFGKMKTRFPSPIFPNFDISLAQLVDVLTNGLIIAFLAGVESLISTLIGDGLLDRKPRSNIELIAQGIANFGAALFGGLPETGSIPRTCTNVQVGGKSPISGISHSLTVFCMLFVFSQILDLIPLTTLAAILIVVSYLISDLERFLPFMTASYGEGFILLTTFFLTLLVGIQFSIIVGTFLSALLFMYQMSKRSKTTSITLHQSTDSNIEIYEVQGPLFFGTKDLLQELPSCKVLILEMQYVPIIDASGMFALQEFFQKCKKNGTHFILSGVHDQLREDIEELRLIEIIHKDKIFPNIHLALTKARSLL